MPVNAGAVSIYAIVLVLIGVSLRSSGKTTTNTAASKPAPAATDTAFKTLPGLTVKVTIARSARTPDRNCDGLAFAAAAQREYRWWSAGRRLILGSCSRTCGTGLTELAGSLAWRSFFSYSPC